MQRSANLDWIRVIGIFLVITVHTWSLANVRALDHPVLHQLYHAFIGCGVPLFLLISGALQLNTEVRSLQTFYGKRYKRLLIPFLFWASVVYVLSAFMGKYVGIDSVKDGVVDYFPYLLENKVNMAYWYIPLMVVLYALTPFLQKALMGCSFKEFKYMLVVWLLLLGLRDIYPSMYLFHFSSDLLFYLGLYISGFFIYNRMQASVNRTQLFCCVVVFFVSFALFMFNAPALVVWRSLMCLSAFSVLLYFRLPSSHVVQKISLYSYAIYLFHMIFIRPLYTLVHFDGSVAPLWQCCLWPLFASVIVLIICYIVCYLGSKLPFHKWLGIN